MGSQKTGARSRKWLSPSGFGGLTQPRAGGYFGPGNEVCLLLSGYARTRKTCHRLSNGLWIAIRNKQDDSKAAPRLPLYCGCASNRYGR
jgi:hypothetical protein